MARLTYVKNVNDIVRKLGPGLITGAADDDPSGIATYSQAGSQFRFGLVWTLLLTTPLMIGIQMLSARIGWVTGEGLGANIGKVCPRWLTLVLIFLLVAANTINIAADLSAMGEAVQLLGGGNVALYIIGFGLISIAGQIYFSYERTVRIMAVMMRIGQSRESMGVTTISHRHRILGWSATGLMALAVLFMLYSWL